VKSEIGNTAQDIISRDPDPLPTACAIGDPHRLPRTPANTVGVSKWATRWEGPAQERSSRDDPRECCLGTVTGT
jgi:hypothetical protein